MLSRQLCPRLCSLPLPVQPEYASPHVYTHLKVLQAALSGSSVSDNVRIAASSMGMLTALQRSASASGFSKLAQLLADARSQASSGVGSGSSTSASSSASEFITMKDLLADPRSAPGFRHDPGCLAQYLRRFIPEVPAAWMVNQDGAPAYVTHVLENLYPKLGQANIKRIVQTLSVEGEHALGDLFLLALHEPNAFYWLQCDLHISVGPRYFGDVLALANELSVDNIEKYRASIVASLIRSGHAYTELRLGTLFYYVRQRHPSANYQSLLDICTYLCSKPEVAVILSLGRADDRHFYDTLSDILGANALTLSSMVEMDITAAMFFLDTDVRGVFGDKGAGIKYADRPVGPRGVYLSANPNAGKTQVGAMVLHDLANSGYKFGLVIAATNADKGEMTKRLESFGFTVILPELNPYCMGKPDASRLELLVSLIDRTKPTVIATTLHSLPLLLWSKHAIEKATEVFQRKHELGAVPLSRLFNMPAMPDDIGFCYVGETQGVLSALGSELIANKDLAMHALAVLCGGVRFNVFDGAVDAVSFLFAKDLCHNVHFHVHVPPDVPRKVTTMLDTRLLLLGMEEQLRNPDPFMVLTDSASMVPVVAAAIQTVDAARTVVTMTADHQDVPFSELNTILNAGAVCVGSPYLGLGLDVTEPKLQHVFFIIFGHSAPGPVLDQMTERARMCKFLHVLFANNWSGPLRLARAPAETKLGLCMRLMEIIFDPNLLGGYMPTLTDGVPSDLDEVLRLNQAEFYTRNLQAFLTGNLQAWLFVGMDRHVPRNLSEAQLAQVVLHVDPGTRHALVAYCRCDVKHVDSTFDGAACQACGTIPLVFPAGYIRGNWFRRPQHNLGKNADFMEGECWQDCEQPDEMPMLPVISAVAMDSIRQLLQNGDQPEYRRTLHLLSRFLSKGYTVEYAEAPRDGVALSAGMMAVAEAIRAGGTQDAITTAILGLGDNKGKVGLPRNELLREMLGAGNPDDRSAVSKVVKTQAFLTTLGIIPSLEVVDRLAMATGLAWNVRFPGWGLKKKLHWFRQLVVLAGYPDYLSQWMRSVLYVYEGSEPPASGIGGADELSNHIATVRFSRLAVLLRQIEGKGSQTPLILDVNGLAFPGIDVNRPVVELANCIECLPILSAITGGSAAFGLHSGALADLRAMSLMDTIGLLKKLSKRLWGMSLKWRPKTQTLQWQRPHLATRLSILHLRLLRDLPAHSPDARVFLQRTVRDALMGVDVTEVPLFDIADIRKPSPTLDRTMTAGSLPSTVPYDDGSQSQPDVPISKKEMQELLAYMQPAIAKKPELAHFGTTRHLEDLWARLTLDERALVLGGNSGATRAHLQLKLNLGKLALEILEAHANPTSVLGQTINKMRQAGRLDTLNSLSEAASQENAFRACDAISEPSESSDSEEEEEPPSKKCRFLDDEAGEDDRVSSSVETETYD